ncbi:MAG TPA: hypothetical protein V6D00_07900 [Pantanalinema sp.]
MPKKSFILPLVAMLSLAGCGLAAPLSGAAEGRAVAKAEQPLDPRFFARREVMALRPEAFALMPASFPALQAMKGESEPKRQALVRAVRSDAALHQGVQAFDRLSWEQQLPLLRRFFELECKVLGIVPPELRIATDVVKGPAFFDFDPEKPGSGRVILNPEAIAKEPNKYTALLLLAHETRHSAQFQLAFDPARAAEPLPRAYQAAFRAQKQLGDKLNFCDFCTLHNEFEAFQFGNYVVGALTDWRVDTGDMGTLASQYDAHGHLKLDLLALERQVGRDGLLDAFNAREKVQYQDLYDKR